MSCIVEEKYKDEFPNYYHKEYIRPPMRLQQLLNAAVIGCAPRFVVSRTGVAMVDNYALGEIVQHTGFGQFRGEASHLINNRVCVQQRGVPYTELYSTYDLLRRQKQDLDVVTISEPVYLLVNRWTLFGHYSHEVCGQIPYWRSTLRPLGVKLLTIRNDWQAKLLRSMGVDDNDIIDLPARFQTWDYNANSDCALR